MSNAMNIISLIATIILGVSTLTQIVENIRHKDGKVHVTWSKTVFIMMMILLLLSFVMDGAVALEKLIG